MKISQNHTWPDMRHIRVNDQYLIHSHAVVLNINIKMEEKEMKQHFIVIQIWIILNRSDY